MFEWFKKKEPTLPVKEQAWSELSRLYTGSHFEKYNPDDLIGRKGFGIYRKMMLDEQIKACVKFKRDAITSRDYIFVLDAEEYNLSEEEVDRRLDISYKYIDKMRGSWMDALNYIMSAMYQGFSMTEKVYGTFDYDGKTWWGIDRLKLKPYDTFVFKRDEFGNIEDIKQKAAGKTQAVDLEKFIHYVINPDYDDCYGSSELRECYRAWFSKDMIIKFRNMWLERHAGGFRWLQADEKNTLSQNSPDWVTLQNLIANVQVTTSAIIPRGFTMNSDYPNNVAGFKEAIDDCDRWIARAMLVPSLLGISPQGDTGSYSQSITQLEAFLWTLDADASRLEDVLNEQLFRQLGEINFGDDAWPRFQFKPASMSKKMDLIKTWSELVSKGAVTNLLKDENRIREMLEFDAVTEEELNEESTANTEPSTEEQDAEATENTDERGGTEKAGDKEGAASGKKVDEIPTGETIIGKGSMVTSSFTKAQLRVDFAVLGRTAESVVDEYTLKSAEVMGEVVKDLIEKAKSGGDLKQDVSLNIKALKADSKLSTKLNKVLYASLVEGQNIGVKHAEIEIDKAKKSAFSRSVDRIRINLIAEDFFKTTAFKITGNLTDEAIKLIENEILNGAKYDYTWEQIEDNIYNTFAKKGLISIEQTVDALGEALGVSSPDARLRTIVRTGTFDAINNARYSYFTDPGMDGFVIGFEYSSVLDSRTTDICRKLDEDDEGDHSVAWWEANAGYRPPNHFNCRSLLVPVTQIDADSFVEGPEPSVEPQAGFFKRGCCNGSH